MSRPNPFHVFVLFFAIVGTAPACSSPTNPGEADTGGGNDSGASGIDSGGIPHDTGVPPADTGSADTGTGAPDTGPTDDAGAADDAAATDAATLPDVGPIADAGGSLGTCGGFGGATCGRNEYCDYDGPVSCGAADGTGVCRARPTVCAPDTTIVCGCDGTSYPSACEAAAHGTDVASTGSCGGDAVFACGPSDLCTTASEYCQVTMGGAAGSPPRYACRALPASCAMPATCASCFPVTPGGSCTEGGPGELTITILAP
jgi:hypothetical protein